MNQESGAYVFCVRVLCACGGKLVAAANKRQGVKGEEGGKAVVDLFYAV